MSGEAYLYVAHEKRSARSLLVDASFNLCVLEPSIGSSRSATVLERDKRNIHEPMRSIRE